MRGWNEIRSRISDSIREMKHAAPKGSGRRLSYMKRYFLKMLLLIIILVGVLVFMMTRFSKSVVGDEIISLHRSILNQTIRQPAETIRSLKESLEKITENTRVIDWIVGGEGTRKRSTRISAMRSTGIIRKAISSGSIFTIWMSCVMPVTLRSCRWRRPGRRLSRRRFWSRKIRRIIDIWAGRCRAGRSRGFSATAFT